MGNTRYLCILRSNAFGSIDYQYADIAAFYSGNRTHDHKMFKFVVDFAFLTKACSINENVLLTVVFNLRVNRITPMAAR